ncbi:MAG: hotdog fold domain-containing protein, partial [Planctomycetota bacterium]
RAKRLSPSNKEEPVALLAAARSLRFYLPIEPSHPFEVEATIVPDEGELALVQVEARRPNGERAARGELRFLVVPPVGEHAREGRARDALRKSLGPTSW